MTTHFTRELQQFQDLWQGGYSEGDPLNALARSGYGQLGFLSVLHATYLRCIRPYVKSDTVALELGPGRGSWTKSLLPAREVYALDALPEAHNRFYEHLGYPEHVRYYQVTDFDCAMLPTEHFNYMFSFGCLCHVSFEGIKEYAVNIWPKLKPGSDCFWMIADYDKYNSAVRNLEQLSVWGALMPQARKYFPLRWLFKYLMQRNAPGPIPADEDDEPRVGGRWYHAGIDRTCPMLEEVGYQVVDPDVGTCLRDPIIHFRKV